VKKDASKIKEAAAKNLIAFISCGKLALLGLGLGQTPDFPATHAALATVAPFPAWRSSPNLRCAEPEV